MSTTVERGRFSFTFATELLPGAERALTPSPAWGSRFRPRPPKVFWWSRSDPRFEGGSYRFRARRKPGGRAEALTLQGVSADCLSGRSETCPTSGIGRFRLSCACNPERS